MNLKATRAAALLAALSCSTLLSSTPAFAQAEPAQNEGQKAARGKADRSTYYRVQASYLYLGERVDFDIQVGCNVYVSVGLDRDRSMMTGLAPMAYGLPMKDGGGLVIVPPKACGGETSENGKIPSNYIPYPITFEDYTKPFEGLGYQSTEAFDSPISKLKFIDAKVTASTKEAFEAWRTTEAPKNIIKPHMLTFKLGDPFGTQGEYKWRPGGYFPDTCFRLNRAELPKEARPRISQDWPTERPKYWIPTFETRSAAFNAVPHDKRNSRNWQVALNQGAYSNITNMGTLTKINKDFVISPDTAYDHTGTFYPFRNTSNLNDKSDADYQNKMTYLENEKTIFTQSNGYIYNKYKGFSLCQAISGNTRSSPRLKFDLIEFKINETTVGVIDNGKIYYRNDRPSWIGNASLFSVIENDTHIIYGMTSQFIGFGGSL